MDTSEAFCICYVLNVLLNLCFKDIYLYIFLSLQTSLKTSSFAVLACNQALQWESWKNSVNPKAIISIYRNRGSFLKVCNSYVEGNRLVSSLFGI